MRFGSAHRDLNFRIARDGAGNVVGLHWSEDGPERTIPRISPLIAALKPATDPDPSFTQTVHAAVRAFAEGGAAVRALQQLTPGARTGLSGSPARPLAGSTGLIYLSSQDVSGRRIERHGGAVARVMFYRVETGQGPRWLLVHLTADKLITDYDVVDK